MKEKELRKIQESIEVFDDSIFNKSIDSIIEWAKTIKKENSKYDELFLSSDNCSGHYDSHWTEFHLTGVRKETEEERDERIEKSRKAAKILKENKAKKKVEAAQKEREEYERLKEKFEK